MSIILKMVDHLLPVCAKYIAIVAVQALVYLLLPQSTSIRGVQHTFKTTYVEPRPLIEICTWCMTLRGKLFVTISTVFRIVMNDLAYCCTGSYNQACISAMASVTIVYQFALNLVRCQLCSRQEHTEGSYRSVHC